MFGAAGVALEFLFALLQEHVFGQFERVDFALDVGEVGVGLGVGENGGGGSGAFGAQAGGFFVPIDLVNTFGIPAASTIARTGPPAMVPVPTRAGFNST